MVLRDFIVAGILLILMVAATHVSSGPISTKNGKSSADDVHSSHESGAQSIRVPLVVSAPSKVFRANKVNSNDVFERPIEFFVLPDEGPRLQLPSAQDLEFALPRFHTTTPKTTTTTSSGTTTDDQSPESATTVNTASREITTTTTRSEEPSTTVSSSMDQTQDAKLMMTPSSSTTRRSTTPTSTTNSEDDTSITTTETTSESTTMSEPKSSSTTTMKPSLNTDGKSTTNATSPTTPSSSSRSEEAVERDYGQSLGVNGASEVEGAPAEVEADNRSEAEAEAEFKSSSTKDEAPPDSERRSSSADSDLAHVAEDRLDDVDVVEEASAVAASEVDSADPIDRIDEAEAEAEVVMAQPSELDYVIVDPAEFGRRADSWDVSALHEAAGLQADHGLSSSSSSVSIKPADVNKDAHHPVKKTNVNIKALKPIDSITKDAGRTSSSDEPAAETLDMAASEQRSLFLLAPEVDPKVEVAVEAAAAAGSTRESAAGADHGSSQQSPLFEDEDVDVGLSDHADPEVLSTGDDGEYEYIYEYIDLNSTDIPANLPEGAVIVTADGDNEGGDHSLSSGGSRGGHQVRPAFQQPPNQDSSSGDNVTTVVINSTRPAATTMIDVVGPKDADDDDDELDVIEQTTGQQQLHQQELIQPITSELPAQFGADSDARDSLSSFVPGMPDSPVYFVGIRREKMDLATTTAAAAASSPNSTSSDPSLDGNSDKALHSTPGGPNGLNEGIIKTTTSATGSGHTNEAQLMSLYGLSKALPFDLAGSMDKTTNESGSDGALFPADLPDPFSEEFLRGRVAQSNESEFTASSDPSTTTTTTTIATTTPTTTTTTAAPTTTIITTTAALKNGEGHPTERSGGNRQRGSRRSTTTTIAPAAVDQAVNPPTRKPRPSRVDGQRRRSSTTPAPTVSDDGGDDDAASSGTAALVTTEKPKFGARGRGRFSANRATRPSSSSSPSSVDSDAEDTGDSNTIANNGGKRVPSGRRTTTARPVAGTNVTKKEDQKLGRRTSRPAGSGSSARGKRPTTTPASKTAADKGTPTGHSEADGADTTTRKSQLFRPRNRSRFGPKSSKSPAHEAAAGESVGDGGSEGQILTDAVDQQPESSSSSSSKTATSKAPSPTIGTANEVSAPAVTESVTPAAAAAVLESDNDGRQLEADQVGDEDEAYSDVDQPPRKFPPRFKAGSRATIPHRTSATEASV